MGLHDIDTMNAIRKELDTIDPSIIIYGEGWTAAGSPLPRALQALKENAPLLDERIAVFSDDIRDGIRGSVFSAKETGFVTGGMTAGTADPGKLPDFRVEDVKFGIAGGTEHPQIDLTRVSYSNTFWAKTPGQTITYASAHDNLTLWDKLAATNPGADDETLLTLNKLAAAIVLTSQGAVFFQAGEEMARTKGGNDNSYNAPDATNKLDWSRQSRFASLTDYYCGLITLRKTYDAFRLRSADEVRTRLKFLSDTATAPDVPLIACTLETAAADYPRFTLLFNGSADTQTAAIPPGNWAILVNGDQAGTTPLGHISGGQVTVPGKTALILGETR
jgi:pullulanase